MLPGRRERVRHREDRSGPVSYTHLAYIHPELGVETPEDALAGAKDIIAEWVSDDAGIRKRLRVVTLAQGVLVSKAAKSDEESVYEPYYDFRQPVRQLAGHRVLAMDRGEREGFLKVSVESVSYTHLDVYKRQILRLLRIGRLWVWTGIRQNPLREPSMARAIRFLV